MKKIVIVLVSRKDYADNINKILKQHQDEYDECHIWLNTYEDIEFYDNLFSDNKTHIIKLEKDRPDLDGTTHDLYRFYKSHAVDPDSVYIKIDDDMVWFEEGFFTKFFDLRIANPDPFLLLPCIINNAIVSHVLMRQGVYDWNDRLWYDFLDPLGWGSGTYAEETHRFFLDNIDNLDFFRFGKWVMGHKEVVSINCISFFGKDMIVPASTMNGRDDETHLSQIGPTMIDKYNCIIGSLICCHYSFYPQRAYLDTTNILDLYAKLI